MSAYQEKNMNQSSNDREFTNDMLPEGAQTIEENDNYRASVVEGGSVENYKAITVKGSEAAAMALSPVVGTHIGIGPGPLAGNWPAVAIKGAVYSPDGKPVESTLGGVENMTVIVLESPQALFDVVNTALAILFDEERYAQIREFVHLQYDARMHADDSDMSVLEKAIVASNQGYHKKPSQEVMNAIFEEIKEERGLAGILALMGNPEEFSRLVQEKVAKLASTEEETDDSEEDIH